MPKKTDLLGNCAKSALGSFLTEHGFSKQSNLTYYRLRGGLVDVIALASSRWGGSFYLYYAVNLVSFPWGNILSDYTVGMRLSGQGSNLWNAESVTAAERSLAEVRSELEARIVPWFNRIDSLEDYLDFTRHLDKNAYKLREIFLLALLGRDQEAISLIRERSIFVAERLKNDVTLEVLEEYRRVESHLREGTFGSYADDLAARNLKLAKVLC